LNTKGITFFRTILFSRKQSFISDLNMITLPYLYKVCQVTIKKHLGLILILLIARWYYI
jgi:hypothetical protein